MTETVLVRCTRCGATFPVEWRKNERDAVFEMYVSLAHQDVTDQMCPETEDAFLPGDNGEPAQFVVVGSDARAKELAA